MKDDGLNPGIRGGTKGESTVVVNQAGTHDLTRSVTVDGAVGIVADVAALRAHYAPPVERAVKKQLAALDVHCRRFIGLSPFLVISSAGAGGKLDASPRGGDAGFVKVPDAHTLLIPDSPGNNRLDTMSNILETGRVGLLFLIPGIDETLRVNGTAELSDDPQLLEVAREERRLPKLVIRIGVEEAYLHCAKALMRSRLWEPETQVERTVLPSMGQMIRDQSGMEALPETQEQMVARYRHDL
jgi:PPOX class probable FMN-dependent enzyme